MAKSNTFWNDDIGMLKFRWIIAIVLGVVVSLTGILMGTIIPIGLHQSEVSCHNFQSNTGLPTKFVEYNSFWDYGCLAKVNGHWVPTDQLVGINGVNK